MTEPRAKRDGVAIWCGWVLVGGAALTPLMAWLGPMGFTALVSLMGLLSLPAFRVSKDGRWVAGLLAGLLAWALITTLWSPFHPGKLNHNTALKLALQLPLYWSAICGARRAHILLRHVALALVAWGMAIYGAILLVEAFSGAAIYGAIRAAIGDPAEFPYLRKNLAQGLFAAAVLWPIAAAAGARSGAPRWLAIPMALGVGVTAHIFLADAPVLAVGLALAVGAAVMVWPTAGPKSLGLFAAALMVLAPLGALAMQRFGIGPSLPESWAQRATYWIYTANRIAEHPLRGWGLDASRMFSPHIALHPHNGALQVWVELGALGAVLGAFLWAALFRGMAGARRDTVIAAGAGSAAVYLFFGMVSFGVWQEWWLALGALVAVFMAAAPPKTA